MQKLINVMAVASFAVSSVVVGGSVYLFTQKDTLIEQARERATEAITEMLGTAIGSSLGEGMVPDVGGAEVPVELPVSPF